MIEFLTENWKLILTVGCIILETVVLLISKKRPEVIDNSIMLRLSEWILIDEKKFIQGSDKLNFVLEEAQKYLGDKYVRKDVENAIEYLLTLPEKKEKK